MHSVIQDLVLITKSDIPSPAVTAFRLTEYLPSTIAQLDIRDPFSLSSSLLRF